MPPCPEAVEFPTLTPDLRLNLLCAHAGLLYAAIPIFLVSGGYEGDMMTTATARMTVLDDSTRVNGRCFSEVGTRAR